MRVCVHCKAENPDDHRFCGSCGAALAAPADAPEAPPVAVPSSWGQLTDALKTDSSAPARLTLAALEWFREGNLEDALLGAESALTLKPDYWAANLLAGVILNQRGRIEAADDHLQRAIHAEPASVYHKATLERELIRVAPKQRWTVGTGPSLGNRMLAIAGAVLVVVGLMAIANQFGGRPRRPMNLKSGSGILPASPSGPVTGAPGQAPAWNNGAGAPGGGYTAPSGGASGTQYPPASGSNGGNWVPPGGHPTSEEATDAGTPITQRKTWSSTAPGGLPPAEPDLSGLKVQPRRAVAQADDGPEPQPIEDTPGRSRAQTPAARSPQRPRVGAAGPAYSPTLPPSDRPPVASVPTWPQPPRAQQPPLQPVPGPSSIATAPPPEPQPEPVAAPPERVATAPSLQREGLRALRERRYADAQAALGQALQAYQQQIARGENVEAARRALDATEAARRLAESRQ